MKRLRLQETLQKNYTSFIAYKLYLEMILCNRILSIKELTIILKNQMKKTFILLFSFFLFSCNSEFKVIEKPTEYSEIIKLRQIVDAKFSENGDCFMLLQKEKRFTPSLDEIKNTEKVLRKNIRKINSKKINQGDGCPIIHNNLNLFRRQYWGYYNEKNEKVIFITFNKNKLRLIEKIKGFQRDNNERWKTEREIWQDGCSNHWEIKVNLTTMELFEFRINGIG